MVDESLLEKYVKENEKDISIDWEDLIEKEYPNDDRIGNYTKVLEYLKDQEILCSQNEKNSFIIIGQGMILNPSTNYLTSFGFKKKNQAESYAKAKFKYAQFSVQIAQIKTAINKV